jgi:hypothetical protein
MEMLLSAFFASTDLAVGAATRVIKGESIPQVGMD